MRILIPDGKLMLMVSSDTLALVLVFIMQRTRDPYTCKPSLPIPPNILSSIPDGTSSDPFVNEGSVGSARALDITDPSQPRTSMSRLDLHLGWPSDESNVATATCKRQAMETGRGGIAGIAGN